MPPSRLLYTIGASDDPSWFLRSGRWAAEDICALLGRHIGRMEELGAVLDFGCGVGRVVRHWADLPTAGVEVVGTDYNPALTAWCRRHLGFARFLDNTLDGRIDADDGRFGLAYALSVFTHMAETRQRHWLAELHRVLRPGGFLFLTLHGDIYRDRLSPDERDRYDRGQLVVVGTDREGSNDCAAFHPRPYLDEALADGWELLEWLPSGSRSNPHQDVYLLRKPATAAPAARAG